MGLELAYSRSRDIIGQRRPIDEIERLAVAVEVEELRLAWRPKRVQVVLLAESHVWTSHEEIKSCVRLPNGNETGFARFVYCLGYGEPCLVKPKVAENRGTPQFWRLFHDTVYEPTPHTPVLKRVVRDPQKRIRNKLDLLEKMRNAGIWLVDASVSALYHKGKKLAVGRAYHDVLKACWECYVGEVVCGCAPSAILIVGYGVKSAIGDQVRHDIGGAVVVETIKQPDARMSREDINHYRRVCFDLCCRHPAYSGGV